MTPPHNTWRAWVTPRSVVVAAIVAFVVLLPAYTSGTGNYFLLSLFTRIVILAMAATTLNLILGYGGMVSFGHAAYVGVGGYAVGILAHEGITTGFIQWPLALLASGLFGLVVGVLSLRTRGVYFIMITLAFAQMMYYVALALDRYGGDDGMTIYTRSQFAGLIDLSHKTVFYYLCVALLFGTIYLVHRLVNSRFGQVIQGSRSNDRRMRAIGFPTFRYRLTCFVIASTLCGLSGALLATHTDFISPVMMHWTRSGDLIVMVVLGGMASVFGPLIGAVALLVLEELLSGITEYWQIILGPLLLLVALYARGGIDGILLNWNDFIRSVRAGIGGLLAGGRAVDSALLQIEGLTKRFGGIVASENVTLDLRVGELHAIIGPNGAGKTTLIGQLTGEIRPDAGRIRFDGEDITGLPTFARSLRGLARSFQITSLFLDFTALDNVALAVQANVGHSFHFWRAARREDALRAPARAALARVGLAERAGVLAANLSHGEHRLLEFAMALANKPRVLLLDEPMAGLGPEESARTVAMLRELKHDLPILLVEHDMEAVFALADRITVLVYGRVIASDVPEKIRANEEVRQAYLGEQEVTHV